MLFKKLGLHPHLVAATRRLHYTEPTPIQAEAIPAILVGRDVIATAQTGTGKTAAFLLPLLHRFLAKTRGAPCLILSPTRELAQQIETVCRDLVQQTGAEVVACAFVLELTFLGGRDRLAPVEVTSLVSY